MTNPHHRQPRRDRRPGHDGRALLTAIALLGVTPLMLGLRAALGPAGAEPGLDRSSPAVVAESSALAPTADARDAMHSAPVDAEPLRDETRWFDGRPVRPARRLRMIVTAYSPDERSCAPFADGVTASGYSVWTNGMRLVAADTSVLPFGSLVSVPGYDDGAVVPVLDRGGRIKGPRLDVLYPDHHTAVRWGVRELDVIVWEYADGRPAAFRSGWVR
jgi:3D (Asp-Asp-Asp) domain-containing protein